MESWSGRRRYRVFGAVLVYLLAWCAGSAFALPTHELTRNQWSLVSLPADPAGETVEALFGDDLPADSYGVAGGWYMFTFDTTDNNHKLVGIDEALRANTGYWIIQQLEDSIVLDIPDNLNPVAGGSSSGCPEGQVCTSKVLASSVGAVQWNLVGFSSEADVTFGDTRFASNSEICSEGCTPDAARDAGIAYNFMFRYSPENAQSPFEQVLASTTLKPWDGYWLITMPAQGSVEWVLPVGLDVPRVPDPRDGNDDPRVPVQSAQADAARLLMQGSFGPTNAAISDVLVLGGPAGWVDAQLSLPPTLHLPALKALAPDETDNQRERYTTFWDLAINADDQLRQRMAFALSQIFVISDKSSAIRNYGNMTAAYYDILVNGAFGNYRDLLEAVTLSPAMGVFLTSLGNDKPDEETGKRADENYAREMMQLFSIGLVGLNTDGTEILNNLTYDQSDVESMARVLTGWSWDVENWSTSTRGGWKPDITTLEKSMVAFADHHDTDVKNFLGTTIPAGQSAEADLKMALDRVFNHPNVGPFIGKQLIQRFVTSNPTPAYVARVARVFNDNGEGVRGDLSAVVRAILLDEEARSPAASIQPQFGKLRESILLYSHVLRAFQVPESLEIKDYMVKKVPQLVPMTAPSVFNFFSPKYSPGGEIADAGLVAPEFQLNSESNANRVNNLLMRSAITSKFFQTDLTLNIDTELGLISDAEGLVDHLDLVLTADSLSAESRNVLIEYINVNRDSIENDRLARDIIALIVSSTEFAIQR